MNRNPNALLAVVVAIALAGCASSGTVPVPSSVVTSRSYAGSDVLTANIGDPLFDVRRGWQLPAYEVLRVFTPPKPFLIGPVPAQFQPGQVLFATRVMTRRGWTILESPDLDLHVPIALDSAGAVVGWVDDGGKIHGGKWPEGDLFRQSAYIAENDRAFRAELLYSGLDGQTLKATYREFAGNLIRPAFSQELQYDLTASREIGYKSVRIEILEATNAHVRFRVISDGDLTWLPAP